MQARQGLDGNVLGAGQLDDLPPHFARRGRHRDQHLVRAVVAQDLGQLVGRAEDADPLDSVVLLARVVVDEADRRRSEAAVALELAHDQLPGVAGADHEHFVTACDETGSRPFDQRPGEQACARDERQQQQVVERSDAAGEARRMLGREGVQHEVREQRRDGDAPRRAPHVAGRDVPPPAVVEAEENEDRKLDDDHDREHAPREEVLVVARRRLVETQEVRQAPGGRDQRRVEGELPEPPPVDRQRPHTRTSDAARRSTATTSACCSSLIPGQSGRQRFSREALSVSGNSPSA